MPCVEDMPACARIQRAHGERVWRDFLLCASLQNPWVSDGVVRRAGWVVCNMLPLWFLLKYTGLLRATADEEALGLDSSHHGGSAYAGAEGEDKSMTNGAHGSAVTQASSPPSPPVFLYVPPRVSPGSF